METCHKCLNQYERANASNPDKGMIFDESEKWICQECNKIKIRRNILGADSS